MSKNKRFVSAVPLPIAAVALSMATLGNMLMLDIPQLRPILGAIAMILLGLILLKFILSPRSLAADLKQPVISSVASTLPMALMVSATYIMKFQKEMATTIWYLAICLHVSLICFYTFYHLRIFKIDKAIPSLFVLYVGIAAAAVTCKPFNQRLGQILFGFALLVFLILLPLVFLRLFKRPSLPSPARPTEMIVAAPASLCLAGYLGSYDEIQYSLALALLILSQILYFYSLPKLPKLVGKTFYPSYAALTFPLVITAFSLKSFLNYDQAGLGKNSLLQIIVHIEIAIALLVSFYVLFRYIKWLISRHNEK